jgi:hypothetical protein
MKIQIKTIQEDFSTRQAFFIDGEKVKGVCDLSECPEDAIIGRSLIDCCDLLDFFKMGYEAGKKNEPLEILFSETKE